MLPRLPRPGDLITSTKRWYWSYRPITGASFIEAGYVYAPYIPLVITPTVTAAAGAGQAQTITMTSTGTGIAPVHTMTTGSASGAHVVTVTSTAYPFTQRHQHEDPMPGDPLLVMSFEGTTLAVMSNNKLFSVKAACIEHIMNDFELLSPID